MYEEKTKKELIDLLRKEKEEKENLKKDRDTIISKHNEMVDAYQNCTTLLVKYKDMSESIVKALQGIEGLSTMIYTQQNDVINFQRYATMIQKIK